MRANRARGRMTATYDAKNWFVLVKGKQYGPYTYGGLVRAAARGIVDPKAGVWCVGWDEWRIARDVPGLFEQEPELIPDDQEEGIDSPEENDRSKSTEKVATAVTAATNPAAGLRLVESAVNAAGSHDKKEPAVKLDAVPSIDVLAPPAPALPQRKSPGHRGGVRLAVYSVLALLVILFGAGWAAISLGIIRVTLR
jgi:GYF domain 2